MHRLIGQDLIARHGRKTLCFGKESPHGLALPELHATQQGVVLSKRRFKAVLGNACQPGPRDFGKQL